MNKRLLSIIIPSYNVAKYVDSCLPTFINNELIDKIVIYLVDDGATDDTYLKTKYFTNNYPSLFKFVHKSNGGHGSVINYGIEYLVKTKYFKVIDGDDFVNTNELIKLVNALEYENADIVVTNYSKYCNNKFVLINCHISESMSISNFVFSLHNITYKTKFYRSLHLKLPEKVFFEDNIYKLFPLEKVKTLSYYPFNVYQYRIGNNEQSISIQSRLNHSDDFDLVFSLILNKYNSIQNFEVKTVFARFIAGCVIDMMVLECYLKNSPITIRKKIKKIYTLYIGDKLVFNELKKWKVIKFMRFSFFMCPNLYKKLVRHSTDAKRFKSV